MSDKLVVKDLYKIFGRKPESAMALLAEGVDKEAIHRRTGQTVGVAAVDLRIAAGEVFVVMGLSGSGKSTLVRLLNRLIEPTAGEILVDGRDIAQMSRSELVALRRRDMSMVFQSFALMPHQTVLANAAFGLDVAGVGAAERRERALQALDQVGLRSYAASYPDELSGGMQQRVGLARALANDPTIMLMDEAFSALDPLIRAEMQDELLRLQHEHARTVVFVSHDLDEAMRIGDRIAIMAGGRVVQVGTPDEILRHPADAYVESFFRGVNVSKVLTAGDVARLDPATLLNGGDDSLEAAVARLKADRRHYGYVVDPERRFRGVVAIAELEPGKTGGDILLKPRLLDEVGAVPADAPLDTVLSAVADSRCPVPVVDRDGIYCGSISRAQLLRTLDRARQP